MNGDTNHTSCILLILYYDSKVQLFQLCINTCNSAKNCHISIGCIGLPDSQLVPVYPDLHSHSYPFVLGIHADS